MKSSIKIGRDNTNDIIINEPSVSRNHAIITDLGNGTFEVKDLGSTNGTYVNNQRIQEQLIADGDRLKVAQSHVDWQAAFQNTAIRKTETVIEEKPFSKIRKTVMIGASPENDIIVDSQFVSAHHAKISLLKNGQYFIQDMGSSNGSFVNGSRVMSKNFIKTDVVKIANTDLPESWYKHKKLKPRFFKDHKRKLLIFLTTAVLGIGGALVYVNQCSWFGWGCNLSAKEIYSKNKNAIVHIEHAYYYLIEFKGQSYYVGKNKDFPDQTEANTDKINLLPYSSVSGNGCFIDADGSILTTSSLTNPWLNNREQNDMLREVIASKTLKGLSLSDRPAICGETYVLKFIQSGVVNNQQNYIEGNAAKACILTDSTSAIIKSVKKSLPDKAVAVSIVLQSGPDIKFNNTAEKYFTHVELAGKGQMLTDTFYARKDSFDINTVSVIPLPDSIPVMMEGNAVFNSRGELIGIIKQQKISSLHNFFNQIKK